VLWTLLVKIEGKCDRVQHETETLMAKYPDPLAPYSTFFMEVVTGL